MRYFLITICLLIACSAFFAAPTLESIDKQVTALENQGQVMRAEIGSLQLEAIKINDKIDILSNELDKLSKDEFDSRTKLQAEIDALKNQLKSLEDDINNKLNALENKIDTTKESIDKDNLNTDILLEKIDGRLEGIDIKLDNIDGRLDGVDSQLDAINGKLTGIDAQIAELEARLNKQQDEFNQHKKKSNQKMNLAYVLAIFAVGAAIAID